MSQIVHASTVNSYVGVHAIMCLSQAMVDLCIFFIIILAITRETRLIHPEVTLYSVGLVFSRLSNIIICSPQTPIHHK